MLKIQSNTRQSNDIMQGLGANEKAILERIPVLFLRKLAADIVRAKMRLQFTGWLQYMLPVPFMLVIFIIAGISRLLCATQLANGFAFLWTNQINIG